MNPGELEVLAGLIGSVSPRVVIEIGVNEGRTAAAILEHVPGIERYIGIDVPVGYRPACAVQAHEVPQQPGHLAAPDERFELILRDRGSLDLMPADLPQACAIFIDGDHGWRAVLHDTILAGQIVRPGGVIVWHDYHQLGNVDVRDVLDEWSRWGQEFGSPEIVHVADTWLCFTYAPAAPEVLTATEKAAL